MQVQTSCKGISTVPGTVRPNLLRAKRTQRRPRTAAGHEKQYGPSNEPASKAGGGENRLGSSGSSKWGGS